MPAAATEPLTQPGTGTPTPPPPSAAKPLPDEKVTPAAQPAPDTPASPDMGKQRTGASATRFVMPASGSIIRGFDGSKNKGIDIGAPAGSPVKAADAGYGGRADRGHQPGADADPAARGQHPDRLREYRRQ